MIKVGDKIINFGQFSDGSCHVNINCETLSQHTPVTWLYRGDDSEFMYLWFLMQHLYAHESYKRTLILPFLPNSRQDRTKNDDDVFTLKYFAQLINAFKLNKVETFDVHSNVAAALVNNIKVISPAETVDELLSTLPDNILLAFPDEGAMERYRGVFNIPTIYGIKSRNWETQKVEKLVLAGAKHMIAGGNFLLVDDICGKGSTIYYMAKQLKERGANKIYVYVSHCENTVLKPNFNGYSLMDIPDLIERMYTTNSLYSGDHHKIKIIKEF